MNNFEDIRRWQEMWITRQVVRKLEEYFDAHSAILGATSGTTIDTLKGQRQVLELLRHPEEMFDGNEEKE